MREELAERVRQYRAKARPILSKGTIVVVLLMLTVSGVGAQVGGQTWTDAFEDGDVDGWENPDPSALSISTTSTEGQYSLLTETGANATDQTEWAAGPTLDLSEGFEITGTVQPVFVDTAEEGFQVRLGISSGSPNTEGQNAFLLFDGFNNQTYLATEAQASPAQGAIDNSYDSQWVNFEISTPEDESTVRAKVWAVGSPEPSTYQLERNFSTTETGLFVVNAGGGDTAPEREAYLDSVTVQGTSAIPQDAELEMDTRDYIKPNESAGYAVHFNDSGEWSEVTENATVTSNNTSVLAVNSVEHLLEGQPGVNTTVNVTAEYTASDGVTYNTTKQITVAQATVENLEILPAIWRFGATFGDDTIFFLIIATLTSIVATRFSTAFGGLSLYWVVVMLGWFSGWVSVGILMLATVMCMFIGLNLAANINYGAVGSFRAGGRS